MHSKQKGNIGETAVALELMKAELPVFSEMGDLSKVDLITIYKNKPIKIQVKFRSEDRDKGIVNVRLDKSGPNYRYTYKKEDVDLFAYYISETGQIAYLTWGDFDTPHLCIRYKPTKRNQKVMRLRLIEEYQDLTKALDKILGEVAEPGLLHQS